MRQVHFSSLLVTAALASASLAVAQTRSVPALAQATPAQSARVPALAPADGDARPSRANQLIENITIEDASARIEEHRFGGETRSITVQPKGGLPAYDVQPTTGARTWKILGF